MQTCRDCKARRDQSGDNTGTTGTRDADRYDDDWAYSYRDRYYGAGYVPAYSGSHRHPSYDNQDARSFVDRGGEMEDGSDDPQAGFGDS
jgi:hypothetical protein